MENEVVMSISFNENIFKVNDIIEIKNNLGKPLRTLWRGFNFIGITMSYRFKVVSEPTSKEGMWEYPVEIYEYVYKFLGITVLTIKYE